MRQGRVQLELMRMRRAYWIALLWAGFVHAGTTPAETFESEPEYRSDQLLQPALLSGPGWRIEPKVPIRGYLAQFHVVTEFGELQIEGRSQLLDRIEEIEATRQLAEVSRTRAFAGAIGHASKGIARTVARIGTHPIQTVKSIPSGLIASLRSKWNEIREQSAKTRDQARDELSEDDAGVGPQSPTPHVHETDWWQSSQRVGGKLAKRWIGFSNARRKLAKRMAVDPYSRNALLNRELDRLAWASLAGDKSLSLAIDSMAPGVRNTISYSHKLDDLVWDLDPVALGKMQRERMASICGEADAIARAMHVGAFSPSQWQRAIDALEALRIERCSDLIELIELTETDAEARYLIRVLELLEQHRPPGASIELATAGRMLVARIDDTLVVPMPVDVLSWTAPIAALFDDPALRSARREMWLDGEATMRAQRELTRRGFGLRLDLPRSIRTLLPMPEDIGGR